MAFLQIQGIQKYFGTTNVLKEIDLVIDEGEFLVLVGPSGCGKSTLLSLIAGLEPCSEGKILLDQQDITTLHPSKRDIAMVFQSYALYPNMTVKENITFGLEMRNVPKIERDQAAQEVAKTLQIENLLDRKPSQLSGGQRQRVAMGRAIVREPKVYLFDEPLSNLDAKLRVDMRTEIKLMHQKLGRTTIYVTHDQIEALTLASRIVLLKDGVIQQIGTPDEIYNNPTNLFVAGFIGSPSMNFIPVKVKNENTSQVTIQMTEQYHVTFSSPKNLYTDQVILGVRPEHFFIVQNQETSNENFVYLECFIDLVEMAGADTYILFKIGDQEVTASICSMIKVKEGEKLTLAFDVNRIQFFDAVTETSIAQQ